MTETIDDKIGLIFGRGRSQTLGAIEGVSA